jgi:[acyl-carrier-protein] S-malonyltransferase
MALAFIFPGQGSQSPGMGRDLADAFPIARETFQEVDDALEQKLSRLIFEGPADELTLTTNAQPALMAVSMAVVRVLEREGGFRLADKVALVAGHSLGEYSALTAAGALPVAVTARLLRLRGQAMQEAVPPDLGAMAALLGAEADLAAEICAEAWPELPPCDNPMGYVTNGVHAPTFLFQRWKDIFDQQFGDDWRRRLTERSDEEGRSISNLASYLLERGLI